MQFARDKAKSREAFQDLTWMAQEQLLNMADLDVVLVETSPRDCLRAAQAAIDAGKHIHLDKPAGESLEQFERILKLAEQKQLIVQMGYMYRYNPAIKLLRELVQKGWLGEIFEVHAVMSKVLAPSERQDLAIYPGGMMFELGCHLIDLVVDLLGEPKAISSHAQHASKQSDSLKDNMLAVFDYERAIATIKSSAQEVDGFVRRHLVVCGTEGTCHVQPLDNPSIRLTQRARGDYRAGQQEIELPKYARYVEDAAEMAKVLRHETESRFGPQHDLAVQRCARLADCCSWIW
ncbi:MAG: Gfo/Idh/MocA family oxidoreductase [Pirellulales bacterium]